MAITRAQQARQMLRDGGTMEDIGFSIVKPSKDGRRPGYRRSNYDSSGGGLRSSNTGPKSSGSGKGRQDPMGGFSNVSAAQTRKMDPLQFGGGREDIFGGGRDSDGSNVTKTKTKTKESPPEKKKKTIKDRINEYNRNYKKKQLQRYQKNIIDELNAKLAGLENFDGYYGDTDETYKDFIENYAPSVTTFGPKETGGTGKYSQEFIDDVLSGKRPPPESFYNPVDTDPLFSNTLAGKGLGAAVDFLGPKMTGPTTKEELMDLYSGGIDSYIGARDFDIDKSTSKEMMEIFEPNRFEREFGRDEPEGANQIQTDPCKGPNPPAYCFIGEKADETIEAQRNLGGLSARIGGSLFDFDQFAAEGGRIGAMDGGMMSPEGGIMDLESGRQMYFLGKLVKKATRAVKKIAKSPIGKAALLYGLGAVGGSFGSTGKLFSKGMFNPGNIARGLLGTKGVGMDGGTPGLFGKFGLTEGFGGMMPTIKGGITLASILPLLAGKTDEEKEDILKDYYASQKLTPSQSVRGAGSEFDFYNYNLAADGGLMRKGYQEGSKEPVAKETMPLLDMDGKEMDLREEGGFVPIGRMEKADDVPARLSKNEFVFTADAVRNAGDGNVDKGAEVMYNMMKNLESGGDVSEESQGLEGAREMFQTSKRLEEVL